MADTRTPQGASDDLRAELKRVMGELVGSNRQLQTVLDHIPGYAFLKDRGSRYLLVNQRFLELVGKPRDQVLGRDDEAVYGQPTAQLILEEDSRILNLGQTVHTVHTSTHTGRIFDITKVPVRDAAGSVTALVGLALDVTEKRRTERDLDRARAQLCEAAGAALVIARDAAALQSAIAGAMERLGADGRSQQALREVTDAAGRLHETARALESSLSAPPA